MLELMNVVAACRECEVQEGDLHSVRHAAAAGVQHHAGGGAAGGVRAEEPQGVLPGLRVSPLIICLAV